MHRGVWLKADVEWPASREYSGLLSHSSRHKLQGQRVNSSLRLRKNVHSTKVFSAQMARTRGVRYDFSRTAQSRPTVGIGIKKVDCLLDLRYRLLTASCHPYGRV